jgi:RHS repeat-associated protein
MPATVGYTYLGVGTVVRADYEEPDVRWDLITGSGSNPYAGLDQFGRVADCLWEKHSGTPADLVRLQYGYNRASSRLWRKDAVAAADFDELYSYDSLQRLTSMQRGTLDDPPTSISNQSLEQSWGLDTTGNWQEFGEAVFGSPTIEQERTSNTNNQITLIDNSVGSGWQTPVYDAAGHMLGMPNGVAGGPIARAATYDAWGRMMSITGAGLVTAGTYRYDGLNRRTIKNTQSGSTILETRHYYYSNQWQVLEERVGTSTDAERQYVWGLRYVDDLALRDRDTNGDGTLDERLYAMQDANWNVVAVCDENAAVEERYTYTAYGLPTYLDPNFGSRSSSSFAWAYLYTGRERDNESALQYNRNRYYHARLGCWITRDPMGYEPGDVNLYRYVANYAASYIDPFGLNSWWSGWEFGGSYYEGVGAGLTIGTHETTEPCCRNGIPGTKTVYDLALHGEVGIGAGLQVKIMGVTLGFQFTVATVAVDFTGKCETPCTPNSENANVYCCKSCFELSGNIPSLSFVRSVSIAVFEFTSQTSYSLKICYNWPGCPEPGLAIGACGTTSVSGAVTVNTPFGSVPLAAQAETWHDCFMIMGTEAMLE